MEKRIVMFLAAAMAAMCASAELTVTDVVAKQRYPWNGLVDITCKVSGISGTTNGLKFVVAAVMPDSNTVHSVSNLWVVQNGTRSTDLAVHTNGCYRLVWDAEAELGQGTCSRVVMRITLKCTRKGSALGKVQLWEGGPYWAETNIGAEAPWEYGYYFWWGGAVGYKRENNAWVATDGSSSNYSFSKSNTPTYGKNIATLKSEGWITAGEVLAPEHDAAHVHWGGGWRMPTKQELSDLNSKCDWTWMSTNGVPGYVVKGKGAYASASIFLPAGGGADPDCGVYQPGQRGYYWSSVPYLDDNNALRLDFASGEHYMYSVERHYGHFVRPVVQEEEDSEAAMESAPFLLDMITMESAPFLLDMISGTRIARESESIAYSTTWEGVPPDATAVVTVNGMTLITATEEGSVAWTPATNGTYTLTHKVMSRGSQYGETLTAAFKVVRLEVGDVVAKQRYPWNGLVDITCKVTGINGRSKGLKFALEAVMPDLGDVRKISQFWVVQNGTNSTDRMVRTNGVYRLVWDAQADLGAVVYSNMVMRVTVDHTRVQLWEGGPYWATTNIGADEPHEYGYYFWWGDTVGYKCENNKWVATDGSSSNYSFSENNTPTNNKSIDTLKSEGWITTDGVLAPEHDAAHVHWGGNWRMPTKQEQSDLISKCSWNWTTMNGVDGLLVRGKGAYASASIFLPRAGGGHGTSLYGAGSHGLYWSSVPSSDGSNYAWSLRSYSIDHDTHYDDRYDGQSVRPVQGFTE